MLFTLIAVILIITCITLFIINIVGYLTDASMNKEDLCRYGYVSFDRFMEELDKYIGKYQDKIEYDGGYNSLFIFDDRYNRIMYIHAGINEFEGRRMIIRFRDYWKYAIWKHSLKSSYKNNQLIEWD